ncbi:hypothetical protein [Solidesulfovibrio sp.]
MTADTPRAVPRRHLLRALLGREIPQDTPPDATGEDGAPRDPHAAGDAAYAAGDYPAAVAAYRASVRSDLSNAPVRARLGYALYVLGQFIQARVEFEHALRITDGNDPFFRLGLGLTLLALGKTEKAAATLAAFDDPTRPDLTALAGRIAGRLAQSEAAELTGLRLTLERTARAMALLPENGVA